jgi:hypothetical protein
MSIDISKLNQHSHIVDFLKDNSHLSEVIQAIIQKLENWNNKKKQLKDIFYKQGDCLPKSGDWDIDESYIKDWDYIRRSMTTTCNRVAISQILRYYKISQDDTNKCYKLLQDIGLRVFRARFIPWRLGYDYSLVPIDQTWEFERKLDGIPNEFEYICVALK